MASIFRPRRGKQATAESQNFVLSKGEIFFEVPTGGVGKGIGRIKMGDGTTAYKNLPYFLQQNSVDVDDSTIAFTESTTTANATLLNEIASGAKLKVIVGSVKKLLRNLDTSVTKLNNDLVNVINGTSVVAKASTATYANSAPTMKGATTAASGSAGLVPAPAKSYNTRFLRGDGIWADPVLTGVGNVRYNESTDCMEIYYNGEWIEYEKVNLLWDGYLYLAGDHYTDYTGGWICTSYSEFNTAYTETSINTTVMYAAVNKTATPYQLTHNNDFVPIKSNSTKLIINCKQSLKWNEDRVHIDVYDQDMNQIFNQDYTYNSIQSYTDIEIALGSGTTAVKIIIKGWCKSGGNMWASAGILYIRNIRFE